jgi:hypothetical protein
LFLDEDTTTAGARGRGHIVEGNVVDRVAVSVAVPGLSERGIGYRGERARSAESWRGECLR